MKSSSSVARKQKKTNGDHSASPQPMHRIREVREQEGMSLGSIARRTRSKIRDLQEQEDEYSNIRLSTLYRWQEALDVPLTELLVEPNGALSEPLRQRACLLRVSKTAVTILEKSPNESIHNLAVTLIEQLAEIMPESKEMKSWQEWGQRRSSSELGRTAECSIPDLWEDGGEWPEDIGLWSVVCG